MNCFIDCEFNGGHGELISMAIISQDGQRVFYEVVEHTQPTVEWVQENVMPILNKPAVSMEVFKERLKKFLEAFPRLTLIADHMADLFYFAQKVIGAEGWMMVDYPVAMLFDPVISAKKSTQKHNALEDAKAIRLSWLQTNGFI
ncbi:3'-5' exoribonuclease [compost metagenome]